MYKFLIVLSFATLLLSGCDTRIVSQCDPQDNDEKVPDPPVVEVALSTLQSTLFTPTCAGGGCHAGTRPAAGLNLTAGRSHAALVNIPSATESGSLLVKPGERNASVLYRILNAGRMPPSGKLPAPVIESVGVWIDGGAVNN